MLKIIARGNDGIRRSQQGAKSETTRKAALKWLAAFIVIMAVLTITSQALTELSVALVSTVSAQRGSLERSASADGTLAAGEEIAVWETNLYRVADIFVSVGDQVRAGDPLFRFDLDQVSSKLEETVIALEKLVNNRESAALVTNNSAPDTTVSDAETKLARQELDYQQTVETQDRKVREAEQALADAVAARDTAQREYDEAQYSAHSDAVQSAQESLVKAGQTLTNAQYGIESAQLEAQQKIAQAQAKLDEANAAGSTATPEDIAGYQLALQIAQSSSASTIEKATQTLYNAQYEYAKAQNAAANIDVSSAIASKKSALETAENTIVTKTAALETAIRDRDSALSTAQRNLDDAEGSYKKAKDQVSASAKNTKANAEKTALSLENSDLDIAVKQGEVDALQKLADDDGIIYAQQDGMVTALNLTRYATPSSTTPLLRLSDASAGLTLEVQVSSDDAEHMQVGDEVTITLAEGGMSRATIQQINGIAENTNAKEIVILLPANAGVVGDKVKMRFSKRSESFDALIPLGALRQDSDGYYVYVIRQAEDSLGAKTSVERVGVTLLDQDSTRAAVSGGIGRNDVLVERSDRSLSDGDRVRVGE